MQRKRIDVIAGTRINLGHDRIVPGDDAVGMAGLFHLVRRQSGHIDRIRRLHLPHSGKMQEVIRDHGKIVKALVAGDAAAASQAMRDHLSQSLAYSPRLREQHPGYFKL